MTRPTELLSAKDIDRRDRQCGFSGVGYHWVITRDGELQAGREEAAASVHDSLKDAKGALSVCLIGGLGKLGQPENNFTPEQWSCLSNLILKKSLPFTTKTDCLEQHVLVAYVTKEMSRT